MIGLISLWICCCAWLGCAGWFLSFIHQLNSTGYSFVVAGGFVVLVVWRNRTSEKILPRIHRPKISRRFHRPLPAIFFLTSVLIFLGGVIYPPNDYDGLTYRLPRLLNWLAAGHWFWIPTVNERMNWATAGWEWVAMPFISLLHSDRGLFLINVVGFLLMPGLLFSVFRRLGVARKVAWTWMWVFPLAYGYAMQAGGIENDLTGAVFGLAAVFFGLRARHTQKVQDVWLCGLAAALLTAAKLSDLPLLLPCVVAVWPALGKLRERWVVGAVIMAVALVVSAAPTIILNQRNTGSWTGDPGNTVQVQVKSPTAALLGNSLLLLQQSFMPPVLPGARKISEVVDKKMPASWQQTLKDKFPRYYLTRLNELPQEETSGLGIGITALLLASAAACFLGWKKPRTPMPLAEGDRRASGRRAPRFFLENLVPFAGWVAALAYMLKMGSEATARLMLPYYPLAIVPFLWLPSQECLLRRRLWKIFAALAALCVLPAVIVSPSRPLFPAETITGWLARHHPHSTGVQRLAVVYSTYAHRNDLLAPLREAIPADVKEIGFVAGSNDTDYSLWRPFGQRRVIELQSTDGKAIQVPAGIKWMVIKKDAWPDFSNVPLEEWVAEHHARVVLSVPLVELVSWGAQTWCLVQLEDAGH